MVLFCGLRQKITLAVHERLILSESGPEFPIKFSGNMSIKKKMSFPLAKRIRIAPNLLQLILGLGALMIGVMEYVLSRPVDSTCLGAAAKAATGDLPFRMGVFGIFGGTLPEFIHPLSFALITMALFPKKSRGIRAIICLFWLLVNLLFEIGQAFGQQISQFLPTILPHTKVSDLVIIYFLRGTYDRLDVLAICLGTASAFIISELITRGGKQNETRILEQWETKRHETAHQEPVLEVGV